MNQHAIDITVPSDMAELFVAEGLGRITVGRRSITLQVLAEISSATSVTVTLLQGPATIAQVAKAIKRWTREHRKSAPRSDRLTIRSITMGEVRIIDDNTDVAVVIEILQSVVSSDSEFQFPDELDGLTI